MVKLDILLSVPYGQSSMILIHLTYIHDVNFCFPRVTRTKFIKYNRQFIRSGCNAYKLNYSPDWTCPHQDNFTVYKEILKPYLLQPVKEKNKRKLLRIK